MEDLDQLLADLKSATVKGKPTAKKEESIYEAQVVKQEPDDDDCKTLFNQNLTELDQLLKDLNSARVLMKSKEPTIKPTNSKSNGVHTKEPQTNGRRSFASNATKELDELMASLSDFQAMTGRRRSSAVVKKDPIPSPSPASAPSESVASTTTVTAAESVNQAQPVSSVAPTSTDQQLDTMIGTLKKDLRNHGVTEKSPCTACGKAIVSQMITALGGTWHPDCFLCATCKTPLGFRSFFERDQKPYCEEDYHRLFAPKCAKCAGPILDKYLTALNQTWHPEHFCCAQCSRQFGEANFHEREGAPYCQECYQSRFAPKCLRCHEPIMEDYISALGSQWHPTCFVCIDCHRSFENGNFYNMEGMPYCEAHFHERQGLLCAGCQKPITGRCITAMKRKFHPEHFICAFCLKQLNTGTFKEQADKPYCHQCFDKLFG